MGRGWKIGKKRGEVISAPPPPPQHCTILWSPPFCPALFPSCRVLEGGVTLELGGDLQQAERVLDLRKDLYGLVR